MVQAVPLVEGREYEGMPKQLEVGPIKMDPALQDQVNKLLEKESIVFSVTIKSAKCPSQQLEGFPLACELALDLQQIHLSVKPKEAPPVEIVARLTASFPNCSVIKESSDCVILNIDPTSSLEVQA